MSADNQIHSLMDLCRWESNLDRQVELLRKVNRSLPESLQIKMPSLVTNDYVARALDVIEDKLRQDRVGQGFLQSNCT